MSLIGPRPELVRYTDQYEGEEKDILNVRPGITDFSSVEFINLDEIVGGENADEMYEKYVLKKKNQLRMQRIEKSLLKFHMYKTLYYISHTSYCFIHYIKSNTTTVCHPCVVISGIPALQISSMSLFIVLLDTSNLFANSGAVTLSCPNRIVIIPIKRSIFIHSLSNVVQNRK